MVKFRLGDKKYEAPASWKEITMKQYARIKRDWDPDKDIADRDYFKLLKILINDNSADQLHRTVDNDLTLMSILGWVITEESRFSQELPTALKIGGQTVLVPRDPKELSIGQNIHLRREIEKSKVMEEVIGAAVAIYMQPTIDGKKFNFARAMQIKAEIDEMPAWVIYPIGFFLLRRASRYGMKPVPRLNLAMINLTKKLVRMLPAWLRSIVSRVLMTYI